MTASSKAQTVSGTITLEGGVQTAQPVTFAFVSTTKSYFFTRSVTLNADGSYSLSDIPSDRYRVEVKGAKWLAAVGDVNTLLGDATFSPFLPGGDANNDNIVDATDFGLFTSAYNSSVSDPASGYDPSCDLNGDGVVDATDFSLFLSNYNTLGGDIPDLHNLPLAQVGEYRMISQKGGTGTAVNADGSTTSADYSLVIGSFYGCNLGANVSVSLSGTITTKFRWQPRQLSDPIFGGLDDPSDLPPHDVVVYEWSEAACLSDDTPTGSCDNGIVGGEMPFGGIIAGNIDSYGGQYQMRDGGQTVTLTRNPSATVGLGPLSTSVRAVIEYSAAVYPITLDFNGLTKDPTSSTEPASNVLIGQGVSGNFSIGTYQNQPSGAWLSDYQWTIPGKTFTSYVVAQDESSAVLNLLADADYHAAAPHWYWAQEGSEMVSVTANVNAPQFYSSANPPPAPLPGGDPNPPPLPPQNIGSATKSRNITVQTPDFKFDNPVVGGPITITPDGVLVSGDLMNNRPGISTTGIAGTQMMYRLGQPGSTGRWSKKTAGYIYNMQLINSVRLQRSSGNPFDGRTRSTNDEFWLDAQSPFESEYTADSNPDDAPDVHTAKKLVYDDTPSSRLQDGAINLISVNDVFQTYLMYVPPGGDVAAVPLQEFNWTWQANFVSSVMNGWQSVSPTYTSTGAPYDCHDHPQWSHLYVSDP